MNGTMHRMLAKGCLYIACSVHSFLYARSLLCCRRYQVGKCARLMSKAKANVASKGESTHCWTFIAIYAAWLRRACALLMSRGSVKTRCWSPFTLIAAATWRYMLIPHAAFLGEALGLQQAPEHIDIHLLLNPENGRHENALLGSQREWRVHSEWDLPR